MFEHRHVPARGKIPGNVERAKGTQRGGMIFTIKKKKTKQLPQNSPDRVCRSRVATVCAAVSILRHAAVLLHRVVLGVFVPVRTAATAAARATTGATAERFAERTFHGKVAARFRLQMAIVHFHVNNFHEFNLSSEFLNFFLLGKTHTHTHTRKRPSGRNQDSAGRVEASFPIGCTNPGGKSEERKICIAKVRLSEVSNANGIGGKLKNQLSGATHTHWLWS